MNIVTKHDVEMSFMDGYTAGYEVGIEEANKQPTERCLSDIICSVMNKASILLLGVAIGLALCKFVPGFWEWTSRGLF